MATPPTAEWATNVATILQAGAPVITGGFTLAGAVVGGWVAQHIGHRKKYSEFAWGRAMDSLDELHGVLTDLISACMNDPESKLHVPAYGTDLTSAQVALESVYLHTRQDKAVRDIWTLVANDRIVAKLNQYLVAGEECVNALAERKVRLLGTTDLEVHAAVNDECVDLLDPVLDAYGELRSAMGSYLRSPSRRTLGGRIGDVVAELDGKAAKRRTVKAVS